MKYLIGLLLTMVVIIFVIVRLLTGGNAEPIAKPAALASYADTGTTMRFTVSSPIEAVGEHHEEQITVGRDATEFVLYKGYDHSVVRSKTYDMTTTAYTNFLRALDLSGHFTDGNNDASLKDETGYCALGDRYTYEIIDEDGNVKQHYWSTDCGQKTFRGNVDTVRKLFETQVPDLFDLISDVSL